MIGKTISLNELVLSQFLETFVIFDRDKNYHGKNHGKANHTKNQKGRKSLHKLTEGEPSRRSLDDRTEASRWTGMASREKTDGEPCKNDARDREEYERGRKHGKNPRISCDWKLYA